MSDFWSIRLWWHMNVWRLRVPGRFSWLGAAEGSGRTHDVGRQPQQLPHDGGRERGDPTGVNQSTKTRTHKYCIVGVAMFVWIVNVQLFFCFFLSWHSWRMRSAHWSRCWRPKRSGKASWSTNWASLLSASCAATWVEVGSICRAPPRKRKRTLMHDSKISAYPVLFFFCNVPCFYYTVVKGGLVNQ